MTSQSNMRVWEKVWQTDAAYTKGFSRGGGFKGTATNATWLARQATAQFGPCGIGWGFNVVDEQYRAGAGIDIVHVVRLRLWYMLDGVRGEVEQFGQTQFVGTNKNGPYTDEEAPKKSITDAVSKCLSLLGFAADVYLGYWDDSKYVAEQKEHAGWSDSTYQEPDESAPMSAPLKNTALSVEEQKRAAKQAESQPSQSEVIAIAKGMVDQFQSFTHVDEVTTWGPKNVAAWDVLPAKVRSRAYSAMLSHAKSGLVTGMDEGGFSELWEHYVMLARGDAQS